MHLRYIAAGAVLIAIVVGYLLWRATHPEAHALNDLWAATAKYLVGLGLMGSVVAAFAIAQGGVVGPAATPTPPLIKLGGPLIAPPAGVSLPIQAPLPTQAPLHPGEQKVPHAR